MSKIYFYRRLQSNDLLVTESKFDFTTEGLKYIGSVTLDEPNQMTARKDGEGFLTT